MSFKHVALPLVFTLGLGLPVMAQETAKPASDATKSAWRIAPVGPDLDR